MGGKADLFIFMFRAEIENSLDDAKTLIDLCEKRYKSGEITSYVYNENGAFLERETLSFKGLLSYLDTLDPSKYSQVEDVASEIDNMIKRKVDEYEDPEVIYVIVNRKIKKILTYLNMRD
jgi:hypothetical protein